MNDNFFGDFSWGFSWDCSSNLLIYPWLSSNLLPIALNNSSIPQPKLDDIYMKIAFIVFAYFITSLSGTCSSSGK